MKDISTTKCYTPTRVNWFGLQQYNNSKCWNTDCLQHTKNYSITNLQATQVQNWSGSPPGGIYNTKEHNRISLHASADQELNGEWAIPSVEENESCDVEKNQPPEPGHIKITGNQSVVAALLNKM